MAHAYHNHLVTVPLFADLDESELDSVAAITTELNFSAGTALMNEGAGAHEMVVVVDGTLEVTRAGEHVADIGPGGFAGEMAVLTHARRDATVTAKSDIKALHLDGRAF
ncbi:MAG: cyclic nucleotide-binding domain-containing protein, partial [Actinomycetota bacterium]|nr:cyclic nucleotide-binding domain-containing protein [Actinomycetota bacterium]